MMRSMVGASNLNGESVVQLLTRTFAIAVVAIGVAACSGGSHRSLPEPTTTTAMRPSLCRASPVTASANQYVPPLAGTLQLAAVGTESLNGAVTATNAAGERCTVTVRRNGQFTMYVKPGTYRLTGTSPRFNRGSSACRAAYPVVLQPLSMLSNRPAGAAIVLCDGY